MDNSMSKIRLYGETSGYVELQAPDVAFDGTIVLPNDPSAIATEAFVGDSVAGLATESFVESSIAAIPDIPGIGSNVVQGISTTPTGINTSVFTDTSLTATITPSSATSKILVMVNQQVRNAASNPTTLGCRIRLLRGSTNVLSLSGEGTAFDSFEITADAGGNVRLAGYISFVFLDTPATTSPVTYKTQAATNLANHQFQNENSKSIITLIEVAA
jgi:hypothetical protein